MAPLMSMYFIFNLYSFYHYLSEGSKEVVNNRKRAYIRDLRRFYGITIIGVIVDMASFLFIDELNILGLASNGEGWEWLLVHSIYLWSSHLLFFYVMIGLMPYLREALLYNEDKEDEKSISKRTILFFPILTTTLGVIEAFLITLLIVILMPSLNNYFMAITYVIVSVFWWSFMHVSISHSMTDMEYNRYE